MRQVIQLVKAARKKADKPQLINWFNEHENMPLPQVASVRHFTASEYGARLNAFNTIHDWHSTYLHPCFPQLLGMSQHISTLSHSNSPFSLIGLVHIENEIRQYLPLTRNTLSLYCYFDKIRPHRYGVKVDINIEVSQGGEHCQTVCSSYLSSLPLDDVIYTPVEARSNNTGLPLSPLATHSNLYFKPGIGRRYAKISGDYNPIHLTKWSAKLAGFNNVMAHGNHVLALTLSKLNHNWLLPKERVAISAQFKRPIILPSTAVLNTSVLPPNSEKSVSFELANPLAARRKRAMMSGEVTAIHDN